VLNAIKASNIFKLMGLVVIISLGSFFYLQKVIHKVDKGTVNIRELTWLQNIKLVSDTASLIATYERGSLAWLNLVKLHASDNGATALLLSQYLRSNSKIHAANIWLRQAIRLNSSDAKVEQAQLYIIDESFEQAREMLQPLKSNSMALSLLVEVEMALGNNEFLEQHQALIESVVDQSFYHELHRYRVFDTPANISPNVSSNHEQPLQLADTCVASVQLFATSLMDLRHSKKLVTEFKNHPLHQYICLLSPRYVSLAALNCRHEKGDKIQCNASVWQEHQDITARYLGVVLPNGGANVDSGIMYLDRQDTIEVWGHELSHLLGFVDEYPLPFNHQTCASAQQAPFSHNIAVLNAKLMGERGRVRQKLLAQIPWAHLIKDTTPILTADLLANPRLKQQQWVVGTPNSYRDEIGLFKSKTCDNSAMKSYKPVSFRTQLQYFELVFPDQYSKMLRAKSMHYLMPSFHINVSKSLAGQGEMENAREILKRTKFRVFE
jgi:hypothetical protein